MTVKIGYKKHLSIQMASRFFSNKTFQILLVILCYLGSLRKREIWYFSTMTQLTR